MNLMTNLYLLVMDTAFNIHFDPTFGGWEVVYG